MTARDHGGHVEGAADGCTTAPDHRRLRECPLSQLYGATPTNAAAARRSSLPSSGNSARSVRATTGPMPGTDRRRSSWARHTGLRLISAVVLSSTWEADHPSPWPSTPRAAMTLWRWMQRPFRFGCAHDGKRRGARTSRLIPSFMRTATCYGSAPRARWSSVYVDSQTMRLPQGILRARIGPSFVVMDTGRRRQADIASLYRGLLTLI